MENKTPDVETLKNIGNLITRKESIKKPRNIRVSKVTKNTYDTAIKHIEKKEDEAMAEASDPQKHLLGKIQKTLVELRNTNDFEKLDKLRDEIQFLNKKVSETDGSKVAKKFINELANLIHSGSRISSSAKSMSSISDRLGMQEFSIPSLFDLSALADPTVYQKGSLIRDIVGIFSSNKKEQLDEIQNSIKAKETTLDPFSKKSIKEKKIRGKTGAIPTVDIPSVERTADIGETFVDSNKSEYEKWAIGWRNKETKKMATREEQARINKEYSEKHGGRLVSPITKQSKNNKIEQLLVDKIVVKELILKPKEFDLAGLLGLGKKSDDGGLNSPEIDIDLPDGRRIPTPTPDGKKTPTPKPKGGGLLGNVKSILPKIVSAAALIAGGAYAINEVSDIEEQERTGKIKPREATAEKAKIVGGLAGAGTAGLIGAGVGQVLIPIPGVGAAVGGAIGAGIGAVGGGAIGKYGTKGVQSVSDMFSSSDDIMKGASRYSSGKIGTKPAASSTMTPEIKRLSDIVDTKFLNPTPIVIKETAPQQPQKETIMVPIKGSVRPSDSSFNRFQDRVFVAW